MNMNRFAPNWSDTKTEDLRRLWAEGLGHTEIASRMNITRHAVANKVDRLGLPKHAKTVPVGTPSWSDADIDTLRQLWAEGNSASIIGGRIGRTRNAVIGKVHRLGFPMRVGSQSGVRKKAGRKGYNPGAFRKSRAKPPELRVARVKAVRPQEVPPPEARMVSLMELTPHECKWPIGDPAQEGFGFCGARQFASFPYCQHHVALAYVPVAKRGAAPKLPALHSGVNGSWRQAQVPA